MKESTVLTPTETSTRIVLPDVSWASYRSLLADYDGRPGMRVNYDRGVLEIVSPISKEHEIYSRLLAFIVETLAEAIGLDYQSSGAATFNREDLQRGFEPDSSYYLQSEPRVRGKLHLDLSVDPPPDLAIEVDIAHSSLHKLDLYAAMGVPEVWIYDGREARIFARSGPAMAARNSSVAFPQVRAEELSHWMEQSTLFTRTAWNRRVREWARSLASPADSV
jgi:Uma2 family endonuclease